MPSICIAQIICMRFVFDSLHANDECKETTCMLPWILASLLQKPFLEVGKNKFVWTNISPTSSFSSKNIFKNIFFKGE